MNVKLQGTGITEPESAEMAPELEAQVRMEFMRLTMEAKTQIVMGILDAFGKNGGLVEIRKGEESEMMALAERIASFTNIIVEGWEGE